MKTKIEALKSQLLHGVSPAMATPLQPDGYRVNTAVIPELVNFLLEAGAKGLFVGGTTGEGILLEAKERKTLHESAVSAVSGRVPVLVHVGANRLDNAVALAQHAADIGADAIAAVTPFYYGLDDDSLASYYLAIAQAAPGMPLLLYDIPHMAVNGISPSLLSRLAREIETVAGIKTSQPDAQVVRRQMATAPDHFLVLVGNEGVALGLLAMGADGLISGLSTAVPEPFVALTRAVATGEMEAARRHQQIINQMSSLIPSGRRIGAIKQILQERGIPVGAAVPPRQMMAPGIWAQLETLLPVAAQT